LTPYYSESTIFNFLLFLILPTQISNAAKGQHRQVVQQAVYEAIETLGYRGFEWRSRRQSRRRSSA
jgi:hypothetical protein